MSFSFPINLSNDEIQQSLASMQINVEASQLAKPTYEGVRHCYEQMLLALREMSRDEIQQPKFSAVGVLGEYPEYHDEAIPAKNFLREVSKLMSICGVKDFSSNDIYKPDANRFKRAMCAVINFARFREEKLSMLDELEVEQTAKATELQELTNDRERIAAEIQRLKDQRAARQAEVAPIEAEIASVDAQNAQLNKVQQGFQNEVRILKSQINTLTDQAAEAKHKLSSLETEIEQLQDQVVQSPEKHRMALDELVGATENQRTLYARLGCRSNDNDRKMEMLSKFERELQRCIKAQEDLEAAVTRKKEVSTNVKDTQEEIAAADRHFSDLEAAKQTARRQLTCLQEKLSRLELQCQNKVEVALLKVEEQRKRREALEAEKAAAEARAAETEAQVRAWRERGAEVTAHKDAQVRAVKERYTLLRRAVTEYNRRLDDIMSSPLPDAAQALLVAGEELDVAVLRDVGGMRGMSTGLAGEAATLSTGLRGLSLQG